MSVGEVQGREGREPASHGAGAGPTPDSEPTVYHRRRRPSQITGYYLLAATRSTVH